uniref:Uncharacterized protein n=1 Tax=Molossus molossus TaxID=27622 RepID=A0A7J8FTW1_MOLMO|nr:hypothetical protein HJG59_008439 [Molossus molossus]
MLVLGFPTVALRSNSRRAGKTPGQPHNPQGPRHGFQARKQELRESVNPLGKETEGVRKHSETLRDATEQEQSVSAGKSDRPHTPLNGREDWKIEEPNDKPEEKREPVPRGLKGSERKFSPRVKNKQTVRREVSCPPAPPHSEPRGQGPPQTAASGFARHEHAQRAGLSGQNSSG